MSIEKYRQIDILILFFIAVVAEFLGYWLHIKLPGAGFYLSFSILVCMIGMFRWGFIAACIYPVSGMVIVLLSEPSQWLNQFLLYPFANGFIVITMLVFKKIGLDKARQNPFLMILFSISAYCSVAFGKGVGTLILTGVFFKGIAFYLIAELFNIIMVTALLVVLSKCEGLMSNMNEYFLEINEGEVSP
jgi:hypothetical protein